MVPILPLIAKQQLFLRTSDGTVTELVIEVGQPRLLEQGHWACEALLRGLDSRSRDIFGESSLQALCLALSFLRARLESVLSRGDLLCDVEEEPVGPEYIAAIFGVVADQVDES